jgi:hypothetical protein
MNERISWMVSLTIASFTYEFRGLIYAWISTYKSLRWITCRMKHTICNHVNMTLFAVTLLGGRARSMFNASVPKVCWIWNSADTISIHIDFFKNICTSAISIRLWLLPTKLSFLLQLCLNPQTIIIFAMFWFQIL